MVKRLRVRTREQKKFNLVFSLGMISLLFVGLTAYQSEHRVMSIRNRATYVRELVDELDGVLFELQHVESGRLAAILDPKAVSADRVSKGLNRLRSRLVKAARLLVDSAPTPQQEQRLADFREIEQKVVARIEAIRGSRMDSSVHDLADDRIRLETVQEAILRFHDREDDRVRTWLAEANDVGESTMKVILLTSLLSLLLLVIALNVIVREQKGLILARENAIRATRVKSEFLANMSHEIRTPMNAIVGLADMLAETTLTADQRKYVESFRRAGNTLLNLINDILDLSRVESGRLELDEVPFDLTEILDGCVELLSVRASQKGVTLGVQMDLEVPRHLVGDPTRIRQVLINLLGNAVKFTKQGGVTLRVFRAGGGAGPGITRLCFAVKDSGIGMTSDERARIFDKFRQANPAIYREYGGTGLGLTISEKLVHLMHGKIEVESEPGQGSTFSFTIPLKLQASAQAESRASGLALSARRIRVLVADDSEDNRLLVNLYLKSTPYDLEFAENGSIAVEKHQAQRYDVIFMDVNMPVMDGYSATRAIREWEESSGTMPGHIIALTANGSKDEADRSFKAGCDGHLTKPVKRDMLIRAISEILQMDPATVAGVSGGGADLLPAKDLSRILIQADVEVRELLPGYLANRQKDLEKLRGALKSGQLDVVRSIGHNVKGTAESYGMNGLGEIAGRLEEAAERGDLSLLLQGADEFENYLQRVDIANIA